MRHPLVVSFDLYAFPPDKPKTVDEIHGLMEVDEERLVAGESDSDELPAPPGPEIERFLAELEATLALVGNRTGFQPLGILDLWQRVGRVNRPGFYADSVVCDDTSSGVAI